MLKWDALYGTIDHAGQSCVFEWVSGATLVGVTADLFYSLLLYVPDIPKKIMVCGGGAKNPTLMRFLRQRLPNMDVCAAEDWGYNSLAIGVQAVAYLAVRRLHFLPISFPTTTGVFEPMVGGKISSKFA